MYLRTLIAAIALMACSSIAFAGDGGPPTAAERLAVHNAFSAAMRDPDFLAAAKIGDARSMKDALIGNGAPGDMVLTAQGIVAETTSDPPGPLEYPNNDGICVRWKLVTWYAAYSSPGHPAGWYSMWVCTMIISDASVITYDSPY